MEDAYLEKKKRVGSHILDANMLPYEYYRAPRLGEVTNWFFCKHFEDVDEFFECVHDSFCVSMDPPSYCDDIDFHIIYTKPRKDWRDDYYLMYWGDCRYERQRIY